MSSPVAYIRRSVARTGDPGDISRDFQVAKVRALANGDGPSLRILDGDWGRSAGRHKADARSAFRELLAAIERGEVSTLYAYSADRLSRDVEAAYGLLNACERAGTTIVTSEGRFPPGDRMARQMFGFQAMTNEAALDGMIEKTSAVAEKRKERGDAMGRAPYGYQHRIVNGVSTLVPREGENPEAVVKVFRETGTYSAAADRLNVEKEVRPRFGMGWDPSTVRHVVRRWDRDHGTAYAPVVTHRGSPARSASAHLFTRLLRCPHADQHENPDRLYLTVGSTPSYGGKPPGVRYYCAAPVKRAKHSDLGPYIVAERKVKRWAMEAVKDVPGRAKYEMKAAEGVEDKRAALEARRTNVENGVAAGVIRPERARIMLAEIEAEMPSLEMGRRAMSVLRAMPALDKGYIPDWDADPAEINRRLRDLWQWVELDPATFEPVRAVWTIGKEPPYNVVGDASEDVGG